MGNQGSRQQNRLKQKKEYVYFSQATKTQLKFKRGNFAYHLQIDKKSFTLSQQRIMLIVYYNNQKKQEVFKGALKYSYMFQKQKQKFKELQEVFQFFKKNVNSILPNLSLFSFQIYTQNKYPLIFSFIYISEVRYNQLKKEQIQKEKLKGELKGECQRLKDKNKQIEQKYQTILENVQKKLYSQRDDANIKIALLQSLEQEKKAKNQEIQKLNQNVKMFQEQIQKLRQKSEANNCIKIALLQSLEQEKKSKNQGIQKLNQSVKTFQEQIQKLRQKSEASNFQIGNNYSIQKLKQDLDKQKQQIIRLNKIICSKDGQINNYKLQVSEKQSRICKQQNKYSEEIKQLRQKYNQAKTELEKQKNKNQELNLKIKTLSEQKQQIQFQFYQKQSNLKQIQKNSLIIIGEKQQNHFQTVQKSSRLEQENQKLKKEVSDVKDLNIQINKLKKQIQQIQTKFNQSQAQKQKLTKQKEELTKQNEELTKSKEKLTKQNKQKQQRIKQNKQKDNLLKAESQNNIKLINELQIIKQKNEKDMQLTSQLQNYKNQIDQFNKQQHQWQNQIKIYQTKIKNIQLKSQQQSKNNLQKHSLQLQKQYQNKAKVLQQSWRQKLIEAQSHFNIQLQNITSKYQNQQSEIFDQQLDKIREQYQSKIIMSLFTGDCFQFGKNNIVQKKYMIEQIESFQQAKIKAAVLLYRKDQESNVNFHYYVDRHSNFVLIIKLRNGNKIAAYSRHPIQKGNNPSTGGLIMSLSNLQSFQLKTNLQKCNAVVYDQYFMIFGNSEIRLRFKQQMLFSNFGILNSFYQSRGQKVHILLGQQKQRQSAIQTYEIYQIKF